MLHNINNGNMTKIKTGLFSLAKDCYECIYLNSTQIYIKILYSNLYSIYSLYRDISNTSTFFYKASK